jgi:hypothetical protein
MAEKKEMTESQEKKVRMVKIKTVRDCSINGKILPPNHEVEVTEEEAKSLCDKSFRGPLDGAGEGSYKLSKITRAIRI